MLLRLLASIALGACSVSAHAAVTFSGDDYTFEAGSGALERGKTYAGTLSFADQVPETVSLYLLLHTSYFFCADGECGGDPNFGQEFLPLAYDRTGNQLSFQFSIPADECFQGDCDLFIPGQFDYDFDISVLLYRDPFVLIGDFSDQAAFSGSIIEAPALVPEPSTWVLLIGGFGMVGAAARRRTPGPIRCRQRR